ncbi:MAG: hypothetical protein DI538_14855 [Azospira oryzae]|jgi:hypothetical protein|nr:MAG: hypothetical protein DI538_14855 [Azospira oryzae]
MKKLLLPVLLFFLIGCQTKSTESTSDSTSVVATPQVAYGEIKTEVCSFKDYIVGDCVHIDFSCGDFGAAQRDQMDDESKKLWTDLSVEDSTGYEIPNPKYVNKQFEIRFNHIKASSCQDASAPEKEIEVQNVLSFKLIDK